MLGFKAGQAGQVGAHGVVLGLKAGQAEEAPEWVEHASIGPIPALNSGHSEIQLRVKSPFCFTSYISLNLSQLSKKRRYKRC